MTSNHKKVKQQYSNSSNLEARIQVHKKYSTNKLDWSSWVFNQIDFRQDYKVLELGSGTGGLWISNKEDIPYMEIVITDISEGMLQTASSNLESINSNMTFNIVNAEKIPYDDNSFDIIIANHMLYHVRDINMAISEIKRVLKSNGTLYATTMGNENMRNLERLLIEFDNRIQFPGNEMAGRFGLESGEIVLRQYFEKVECRRYEDALLINEVQPLFDYILSLEGMGNVLDIIKNDNVDKLMIFLKDIIKKNSNIIIKKDSGILIATKYIK